MNKQRILLVLSLLVIGGFYFFFKGEQQQPPAIEDISSVEALPHKEVLPISRNPIKKLITETARSEQEEKTPEEKVALVNETVERIRNTQMDKFDERYEKITSGWDTKISEIFLNEMKLDQEDLTFYFELKNRYDAERLKTFKEFHDEKYREFGDEYRFDHTSDELNAAIETLQGDYAEQLRGRIGEDHYERYTGIKANYNKELTEDREENQGPRMMVEF